MAVWTRGGKYIGATARSNGYALGDPDKVREDLNTANVPDGGIEDYNVDDPVKSTTSNLMEMIDIGWIEGLKGLMPPYNPYNEGVPGCMRMRTKKN